jgi:hypothetical protein
MYHDLPRDATFWSFLFEIDKDLAETTRKQGCPCGGRLHRANYPRQPRGDADQIPQPQRIRLSFCCDRDGCRKRVTPPSVRFLGPKVYLAAVVILISAMRQGPTPRQVRDLFKLCGADRRTIARWQVFWRDHFPRTPFWKVARARLEPVVKIVSLPFSLVDAFLQSRAPCECQGRLMGEGDHDTAGDASPRHPLADSGWERLLRFLAPITITGGLKVAVS